MRLVKSWILNVNARNVRLHFPYRYRTPIYPYFDLYQNTAHAVHYVYLKGLAVDFQLDPVF